MPQRLPVLVWIGARRKVCVDVLERGLDSIQQVTQLLERRAGKQDLVLAEAMSFGQLAGFVGALAVRWSAVSLRASGTGIGLEPPPAPDASSWLMGWLRHVTKP